MNKKLEDVLMPNTQISAIRNAVAERMAHGLNAREILNDISKFSRAELMRVIMDLIENPVVIDEEVRYSAENEHPEYPYKDHQYEVSNGDTNLGYHEWVEHSIERDSKGNKLDARQVATILFALRYTEQTYDSSGYVHSEHIEGMEPMNQMEINRLCEDINLNRITL